MGIKEVWSSSLVDRFNEEPKIPYEGIEQSVIDGEVEKRLRLERYFQEKAWERMNRGVR
jgi:hypothetical protein